MKVTEEIKAELDALVEGVKNEINSDDQCFVPPLEYIDCVIREQDTEFPDEIYENFGDYETYSVHIIIGLHRMMSGAKKDAIWSQIEGIISAHGFLIVERSSSDDAKKYEVLEKIPQTTARPEKS